MAVVHRQQLHRQVHHPLDPPRRPQQLAGDELLPLHSRPAAHDVLQRNAHPADEDGVGAIPVEDLDGQGVGVGIGVRMGVGMVPCVGLNMMRLQAEAELGVPGGCLAGVAGRRGGLLLLRLDPGHGVRAHLPEHAHVLQTLRGQDGDHQMPALLHQGMPRRVRGRASGPRLRGKEASTGRPWRSEPPALAAPAGPQCHLIAMPVHPRLHGACDSYEAEAVTPQFEPPIEANVGYGYRVTSVSEAGDGSCIVANLKLIRGTQTYGQDISDLLLTVRYETPDRVHVKITDSSKERWEVPEELIPRSGVDGASGEENFSSRSLDFSYTLDPFNFTVGRKGTGEVLFNTAKADHASASLVFKDQYLEISTQVPQDASLYGLGESTRSKGLKLAQGETCTLWAADIPSLSTDVNLYGAFPFFMDVRRGGATHGVLLLNSNGMDVSYSSNCLTYRVVGGVLDFYFFGGGSPLSVVSQYTQLVGRPAPMPYWSFGYHQCRWGYKNVDELERVVSGYKQANIPLDVMWSDIDYMDSCRDFTFDPVNFPADRLRKFADELHADGKKYVMIVDPGINAVDNYPSYERGLEADIYIKDVNGDNYLGQVWPGPVNFPDFLDPATASYWTTEISEFHDKVPFDGLWIDMNEASNFSTGLTCTYPVNQVCPDEGSPTTPCLSCASENPSRWDNPPYSINDGGTRRNLGMYTIATSARHFNGVLEYDAHNLYGLCEAIMTEKALRTVLGKRPFILSRSSFVGSGKYAAHWTGDNASSFKDMAYSVVGILSSGLFGIPMVGADIGGFMGDAGEELMNRWIQLGAFYPFARNHSHIDSSYQELYLWETVAASARTALGLRYRMLPFLYTLAHEAHVNGHPIARPLFFEFAEDPESLAISEQFLLGTCILVSPVLEAGASSVNAYFPKGTWYNLFDSSHVTGSKGSYQTLPAAIEIVNVHVHEGAIVPMQESRLTTTLSRKTPFSLLVAFSLEATTTESHAARGQLFLDDDNETEMKLTPGKSTLVAYTATLSPTQGSLQARVGATGAYATDQQLVLQNVVLLGVATLPTNVLINSVAPSSQVRVSHDPSHLRADISGLHLSMGEDLNISWSSA